MANTRRYREYDLAHLKLIFEFSIYIVWKLVRYGVSNGLDTAYWGFLGVGTTLDIFQNLHILYLQYGVLVFSRYGVLRLFPSWSLTVGLEAAYEMSWKELMKIMTEVYCPRNGIQKMESELWRLTVKGMVPDEEKNIERCILGLPNNIQWNVTSDEPTRFQDTVKLANNLMDQKVCANVARQAENKRRWESNQGNNHVQQPPPKRQNVARAYTARLGEKKAYAETLPFYNKLQHAGPCTVKCDICKSNSANITIFKLNKSFGFNDDKQVICNTSRKMCKLRVNTTHQRIHSSTPLDVSSLLMLQQKV
ncbi:hypothetical protein Tco_0819710 [Tanacetum coccineum]|uniref:Uncharacterized protein n=1 Tax=Tanacetum coccineum TaxID=301880 RepID=A0ABQ5A888_9ASTR